MRGTLTHRRFEAPRKSGAVLVQPSLADLSQIAHRNRHQFPPHVDLGGYALPVLRKMGISQLVQLATDYTRSYRDVEMADRLPGKMPVILSGHQPQLFHPGVWFKNFALAASWRVPAISVHLIIDNDVCLYPSVRVPCGPLNDPSTVTIPYDAAHAELPYEERDVRDRSLFHSFKSRVTDAIQPLVSQPLLNDFWPLAVGRLGENKNLGLCLSQARHQLEAEWKLNSLELPLSRICQTDPFRIFTLHLLRENQRLRADYNQSLAEYRQRNRIRSRSHPVPELKAEQGACETPFWVWSTRAPLRRRLFARCHGDDLHLTNGAGLHEIISQGMHDTNKAAASLAELEDRQGIKIRPRALTTTIFARLVLSDVFFHGIGGAKYDQLSDEIVRRFFGIEPPEFVTMTATARLPLPLSTTTAEDVRIATQKIRGAQYHPEQLVDRETASDGVLGLLAAKEYWINQSLPRGQRGQRHREITRINAALREATRDRRAALRKSLEQLRANLRCKSILESREFSFCLFPQETFAELLLALS